MSKQTSIKVCDSVFITSEALDRDRQLFEQVLQRWYNILNHGVTRDNLRCAFCEEYNRNGMDRCSGCPIYIYTGKRFCEGTPYVDAFETNYTDKDLVKAEIRFLNKLWDKRLSRRANEERDIPMMLKNQAE